VDRLPVWRNPLVVLRELQTLMGHPDRLGEWARLTIEAVAP